MLPIGLIIFGGILVVARLLNCVYDCRSMFDEENLEDTPPCMQALNIIFFLALFGMFIAGKLELTRYLFFSYLRHLLQNTYYIRVCFIE